MDDIKHYENLANAIVIQAVLDYKDVYRLLSKNPKDRMALAEAKRLKAFFHSRYFRLLTSVDAEYLIRMIEKETEEELRTGKRREYRGKGRMCGYRGKGRMCGYGNN